MILEAGRIASLRRDVAFIKITSTGKIEESRSCGNVFAKRRYETHPELISITSGKFMSRWKMFVRIFVYLGFMFLRIKAGEKKDPECFCSALLVSSHQSITISNILCSFCSFTAQTGNFLSFGEKVLLMTGQDEQDRM